MCQSVFYFESFFVKIKEKPTPHILENMGKSHSISVNKERNKPAKYNSLRRIQRTACFSEICLTDIINERNKWGGSTNKYKKAHVNHVSNCKWQENGQKDSWHRPSIIHLTWKNVVQTLDSASGYTLLKSSYCLYLIFSKKALLTESELQCKKGENKRRARACIYLGTLFFMVLISHVRSL